MCVCLDDRFVGILYKLKSTVNVCICDWKFHVKHENEIKSQLLIYMCHGILLKIIISVVVVSNFTIHSGFRNVLCA